MSTNQQRLAVVAVLACLASHGWSQDWTGSSGNSKPRVQVAPVAPVRVRPGAPATVALNFRVARGYHINSNTPGSELLIPTALKLSPPTNVSVGATTYPAGKDMQFVFAPDEKLNVYAGDFELATRVIAARNAPPGKYRVRGELKYQACDERACYPPSTIPLMFDVTVAAAPRPARRNPAQSPNAR